MDCKTVRHLIGTDLERYAQENNLKITLAKKISFFFLPCILVLAFQRISHYFFLKGHYLTARLIYTINLILFAADISPNSSLGSHAYLPHPVGIVIIGKVALNGADGEEVEPWVHRRDGLATRCIENLYRSLDAPINAIIEQRFVRQHRHDGRAGIGGNQLRRNAV